MTISHDELKQIWTTLSFAQQMCDNKMVSSDLAVAKETVLSALMEQAALAEQLKAAPIPTTLESFELLTPLGFRHPAVASAFSDVPNAFPSPISLYSAEQLLAAGWTLGPCHPSPEKRDMLSPQEVWEAAGGAPAVRPSGEAVLKALRTRTQARAEKSVPSTGNAKPATAGTVPVLTERAVLGTARNEGSMDSVPATAKPSTPLAAPKPSVVPGNQKPPVSCVTELMEEYFIAEIEVQRNGTIAGLDAGLRTMLRSSPDPAVSALASHHFQESWLNSFHDVVEVKSNGRIAYLKEGLAAFVLKGLDTAV